MAFVVDISTLARGFGESLARFEERVKYPEPEPAYLSLFECLAWASSIDERLGYPAASPELRGVRIARNRVHHQWADALAVDDSGVAFPLRFPLVFFEYRWRRLDDLPPADRVQRDEAVYRQHLQGVPARQTLERIRAFLDELTKN